MQNISFGAIESLNDKRTITADMLDQASGIDTPNSCEILLNFHTVDDLCNQRQLGVCTACATRMACEDAFAVARAVELGYKQSFRISEYWLYLIGKVGVDGNLAEGSSALTMLKAANNTGCPKKSIEAQFPLKVDGSYADFIADFKNSYGGKIPQAVLDDAGLNKIAGYYKVTVDPVSIAKEIVKGKLVIARFTVGDNTYTDLKGHATWDKSVLSPLKAPTRIDGGHLWCICGYRELDAAQIFKIVNSWSEQWCDKGYIDFEFNTQKPYFTEAWCIGDIPAEKLEELKRYDFKNDLKLGMTHPDVKLMQKFLNENGYPVSFSGAGSKGKETEYFGTLTQAALIKFQISKSINPHIGYFGKITRGIVNAIK